VQFDLFKTKHDIEPGDTKTCRLCGVTKNMKGFVQSEKFVRAECRKCLTDLDRLRNKLRESHPYPSKGYICPICKKGEERLYNSNDRCRIWNLDHCYVTNKFRGYLCTHCNKGVGHLGDDVPTLKRAIKYLISTGKKNKTNEVTT
tara:strand:+ start:94 stop:528 length:435 start_codon:yes stop_codon:yes gene_type:complete